MGLKYILVVSGATSNSPHPIIFSDFLLHYDVALMVTEGDLTRVKGAGFVRISTASGEPRMIPYGESVSLKIGTRHDGTRHDTQAIFDRVFDQG